MSKQWLRDLYVFRRERGICTTCGQNDVVTGKTKCKKCHDAQLMRNKKRYTERKEAGLCIECGAVALAGKTRCAMCFDRRNQRRRKPMTYQRAMLALGNGDRLRGMQLMFMLAARLEHARKKHPWPKDAPNAMAAFRALAAEVEEVNLALCKETPDRVRDELLDVMAVAVRMLLGECRGKV